MSCVPTATELLSPGNVPEAEDPVRLKQQGPPVGSEHPPGDGGKGIGPPPERKAVEVLARGRFRHTARGIRDPGERFPVGRKSNEGDVAGVFSFGDDHLAQYLARRRFQERNGTEWALRLASALAALPEPQREAIVLQYWHGLTLAQIGERLQRSPAAVAGVPRQSRKPRT